MKHIKILSKVDNTTVIGAERLENTIYVKYQERNNCIVICSEKEAQGIMTADEKHICQLDNKPLMESNEIDFVASFISEAEYDELILNLDDPQEEPPEESTEEEKSDYMTAAVMRQRIIDLEQRLQGGAMSVNDDATQNFMATLADPSTNSIAKIRAAAQSYLDETEQQEEA